MRLTSLNVGQPTAIHTKNREVVTSIFKTPVSGRRKVVPHNVEGDRQADLRVHGGPNKAVYACSAEHYAFWKDALQGTELMPGMFGENLTVDGMNEADIHIGDIVAIGSARLRVTQPRMPCFKLALRFERSDMVKLFWRSGLSGVYFAVEQSGEIGEGDEVQIVERHALKVSVSQVVQLYRGEWDDEGLYQRAMACPLGGSWRNDIRERREQSLFGRS